MGAVSLDTYIAASYASRTNVRNTNEGWFVAQRMTMTRSEC